MAIIIIFLGFFYKRKSRKKKFFCNSLFGDFLPPPSLLFCILFHFTKKESYLCSFCPEKFTLFCYTTEKVNLFQHLWRLKKKVSNGF